MTEKKENEKKVSFDREHRIRIKNKKAVVCELNGNTYFRVHGKSKNTESNSNDSGYGNTAYSKPTKCGFGIMSVGFSEETLSMFLAGYIAMHGATSMIATYENDRFLLEFSHKKETEL